MGGGAATGRGSQDAAGFCFAPGAFVGAVEVAAIASCKSRSPPAAAATDYEPLASSRQPELMRLWRHPPTEAARSACRVRLRESRVTTSVPSFSCRAGHSSDPVTTSETTFRIDDVVDGPDALGLDPRSSSASSGTRARPRDSESSGERLKVQFRTKALIPASYRDRRQVLLPCPRTLPESRRCLRPGARMPHRGAGRRIVLAVAGCPGGLVRGRTARPRLGAQAGTASAVSRRVAAARSLALTTQNASTTAGSNCVPEQRRSSVSASLALRPAL